MRRYLIFYILGQLVFASCNKEKELTIEEMTYKGIIAGDTTERVTYFDIIDTTLEVAKSTENLFFEEQSYHLDLNKDGKQDFEFIVTSEGYTDLMVISSKVSTKIKTVNNSFIAVDSVNWEMSDTKSSYIISPIIIEIDDTITNNLNFQTSSEAFVLSTMYADMLDGNTIYWGFWRTNFNKYLGVKFTSIENDTLYGWIRIDFYYDSKITIKDFAYKE